MLNLQLFYFLFLFSLLTFCTANFSVPHVSVNTERLIEDLKILGQFSDGDYPGITRLLYSKEDKAARRYLVALFEKSGLSVSWDPVGNIFARWEGSDPRAPAVASGSHFDTLLNAGLYDGTLGVLGALEAVRSLKEVGFEPKRSIDIIAFTSEEVSRFGIGCLGSRYLVGSLSIEELVKLKDSDGVDFESARKSCGYTERLEDSKISEDFYSAFVELHIEQYHILEDEGIPIGLVTDIAAPALYTIEWKGPGGHAGSVPSNERQDPFLAASEFALSLEQLVLRDPKNSRATIGRVEVYPGSAGAIPRSARLSLDIRDINEESRTRVKDLSLEKAAAIARKRKVTMETSHNYSYPPARMDQRIIQVMEDSCRAYNFRYLKLVSRPFHDSLFMATKFPTGMIFIPCNGGKSHVPDEYASPDDISHGVEVLAETLARLSYQ
ncbi:N-carbamoyl-L-amino-acid hydrolase [Galdieria sulphuraria]|uniref:N-carbamoyl-L-amino-acid hydrolase n=1 Tax=Galdieria sulphuraria TaxID=130081 RepID=M2XZL1_GALSU|nr:N-carbamoyl-L-amino-acid hydrolase [Galdieria sulphuraria]EME29014.1 N-carbamoyl-L-amino-acid hydrolase [Galdieria sulphuraria]|eukprot:XP_005705534.1 N-carbamoyl-L-amino-acid hydrolase [Galdieria sulphuraria]